jgi:catechol 2,3-dioxygenase-like lactoylglutathione lyase family enzyme
VIDIGPVKVLGIDNVLIGVGDLAEARRFYGGTLGLAEKFATESMALYAVGEEAPGILIRVEPDPKPGSTRVWLEVPDARALGGEAFEVFTGWTVEIRDPCGNVVGLTDYSKRPDLGRG